MKVLISHHVDVAAPADHVFSFVSDVTRWPVWFLPVVSAQHPQAGPVAVDEELLLCLHDGRRRWHEMFDVTRFVRNAFLSLEGAFSAARRIDFRFEQRAAHTRVGCSIGYRVFGGFLASALDAMSRRRRVRKELSDSLLRLKGMLEEPVENIAAEDDFAYAPVASTVPSMAAAPRETDPVKETAGAV